MRIVKVCSAIVAAMLLNVGASNAEEVDVYCTAELSGYGSGEAASNVCTDGSSVTTVYDYNSSTAYYSGTYGGGFIWVNPEGPPTHPQVVQPKPEGEFSFIDRLPRGPGRDSRPTFSETEIAELPGRGTEGAKLAPPVWIGGGIALAGAALCHANQQAVIAQLVAVCLATERVATPRRINAGWMCGWGASANCK